MKTTLIICLILISIAVQPIFAAFGDRIRPITPNPLYFRNATKRPVFESTTSLPKEQSGSPEPGDDEIPGTPIDTIVDAITDEGSSNGIYPDYDVEDEGKPYKLLDVDENQVNATSEKPPVSDLYPLDPPQTLKENISGSDTYDQYHYAPPPHVSPYDKNKVVFLSPIRPQPGYPTHHPVVKKIVKVVDTPLYRDSGPRIRYIKTSILHNKRHPIDRYPINHHHVSHNPTKYLSRPHEFHHHPHHDAKLYGYIPGIPGKPWKDYPLYSKIPLTGFDCKLTKYPGFYADIDSGCQVWHYCQLDGRHDKFLCPNGTVFNQGTRVCDWWFNVDCPSSLYKYNINADMYRTKTVKKVLHVHPGKKPHVHRIPTKGHGVYKFRGLDGSRTRPISLPRKIHKHHFLHHPHGRPISTSMFSPHSSIKPHFMQHLPKADHYPLTHGHRHHHHHPPGKPIHHLTGGLPVHPRSHHHPYPPGVVRVRKVVVPHHRLHHKISHLAKLDHSLHHIPITDPFGRLPHHGHLILHHHQKAKKK